MCRNLKLNKLKFTFCPTDEHGRVILREIQISIYMFLRSTDRSRLRDPVLLQVRYLIPLHSSPPSCLLRCQSTVAQQCVYMY